MLSREEFCRDGARRTCVAGSADPRGAREETGASFRWTVAPDARRRGRGGQRILSHSRPARRIHGRPRGEGIHRVRSERVARDLQREAARRLIAAASRPRARRVQRADQSAEHAPHTRCAGLLSRHLRSRPANKRLSRSVPRVAQQHPRQLLNAGLESPRPGYEGIERDRDHIGSIRCGERNVGDELHRDSAFAHESRLLDHACGAARTWGITSGIA